MRRLPERTWPPPTSGEEGPSAGSAPTPSTVTTRRCCHNLHDLYDVTADCIQPQFLPEELMFAPDPVPHP